jgi:hypothetical protein
MEFDYYERKVLLSKQKRKYSAEVSPPIKLASSTITRIDSPNLFYPLIKMLEVIDQGEFYERESHPDYDEYLAPGVRKGINLEVKIDSLYIKSNEQFIPAIEYLIRMFKDRGSESPMDISTDVIKP